MIYNLSSYVCLASLSFHPVLTPLFCWRSDILLLRCKRFWVLTSSRFANTCVYITSVCCCQLCLCNSLLSKYPYSNLLLLYVLVCILYTSGVFKSISQHRVTKISLILLSIDFSALPFTYSLLVS